VRGQYQYVVVPGDVIQQAGRTYLLSSEGHDAMERAAADYVKTGLPNDDLPDWTVLFENKLA